MRVDTDMVDKNTGDTTVIDQSPVDPRLLQMQTADIVDVEDGYQKHKTYHFHNCGMVYVDSLNARNVAMDNCGNHIPQTQLTYYRPKIIDCEKSDKVTHSQSQAVVNDSPPRTSRTEILVSVDYVVLFSWAVFVTVLCLAFFIMNSPRLCGIGERAG